MISGHNTIFLGCLSARVYHRIVRKPNQQQKNTRIFPVCRRDDSAQNGRRIKYQLNNNVHSIASLCVCTQFNQIPIRGPRRIDLHDLALNTGSQRQITCTRKTTGPMTAPVWRAHTKGEFRQQHGRTKICLCKINPMGC